MKSAHACLLTIVYVLRAHPFLCYHDLIHKHAFLSSIAKDVLEFEAASFKHVCSCVFVLVENYNGRDNVSFNFIVFIIVQLEDPNENLVFENGILTMIYPF